MFAIGYLIFKFLIIRVIGKPDESFILLTLGLSIVLQNLILMIFGAEYLWFRLPSRMPPSISADSRFRCRA